jgi:hypothetical protein
VFLLALFGGVRARASGLGFGFLLGRVALGVGLVLLSLTLANYVVATGDGSADLFGLAFDTFDDAFASFFWSALVIPHGSILPFVMVELSLGSRETLIFSSPADPDRSTRSHPSPSHPGSQPNTLSTSQRFHLLSGQLRRGRSAPGCDKPDNESSRGKRVHMDEAPKFVESQWLPDLCRTKTVDGRQTALVNPAVGER